jgi:hypothetical protein
VGALLAPSRTGLRGWLETVALTAAVIALCCWLSPGDPFFTLKPFPWPWFAPLLLALRYGFFPGMASAGLLAAAWVWLAGSRGADFPATYFYGGLILVIICGEYGSTWMTRLRRIAEVNAYLEERMATALNQLRVARLSHNRLEQDLVLRPFTLRGALAELRGVLARQPDTPGLPGAQPVLEFLAQQCQTESAAIYDARGGTLVQCAAVGQPVPLAAGDPLFARARETGALTHLQPERVGEAGGSEQLVVAPIAPASGDILGYLVVSRMSFFAMNGEALQVMALMLTLYADTLVQPPALRRIVADVPDCPYEFAAELVKLDHIRRRHGVRSQVVTLMFGAHPERDDIVIHVRGAQRSFDVHWEFAGRDGRPALATLMPLADAAAVTGYLERLGDVLQPLFGADLAGLGIESHVWTVGDNDPPAIVQAIKERAGHG